MSLLVAKIRSGLVETTHHGALAIVSPDGSLLAATGEIDRPFFLRSAAKPFQAAVAQRIGGAMAPLQLALAAASHDGHPAHVALVGSMLAKAELGEGDLQCPPAWPSSAFETRRLSRAGHVSPRSAWHNCSGKHASWLLTSRLQGWPTETYLDPEHPLQRAIFETVSELGGVSAGPVGVDGCGAPVLRTTVRAMASLFAALGNSQDLSEVYTAMHRYPAMTSGSQNGDAVIAASSNVVAKRGAEGCLGVAVHGGPGIAVKSWDGLEAVAVSAMAATLAAITPGSSYVSQRLADLSRQPVFGGGGQVGFLEPRVELQWS